MRLGYEGKEVEPDLYAADGLLLFWTPLCCATTSPGSPNPPEANNTANKVGQTGKCS
jgi:hypothetical protein